MSSIRTPTIASILMALLLLPVVSEAQARRAVPRAAPGAGPQRTAVPRAPYNRPYNGGRYYSGGRYYGSRYYGAGYYGHRYYGPRYYGGYYGYPYSGGGFAYYGAGYGFSIGVGVGVGYPYGYAYGYPGYAYGYPSAYPYDLSSSLRLQSNTINVHHTMEPLASGEAEPSRPVAPPREGRVSVSSGQFGSLALRVQPGGAQVLIDGETWESGDSDRLIVELGPGVHNIEIRKDGFRTYITDITIRPNETTPLNVAMNRP